MTSSVFGFSIVAIVFGVLASGVVSTDFSNAQDQHLCDQWLSQLEKKMNSSNILRDKIIAFNQELKDFDMVCIYSFDAHEITESQCQLWAHSLFIKLYNLVTRSEFEIDYETDRAAFYRETLYYSSECTDEPEISDKDDEIRNDSDTLQSIHGFLCDVWSTQLTVKLNYFYTHAYSMEPFERDDREGWLSIEIDQFEDECLQKCPSNRLSYLLPSRTTLS